MQRKSSSILREYLRHRRETLEKRPTLIKQFLKKLVETIGQNTTIIVFGGRGTPQTLYSTEPRDLDLLIITGENTNTIEEQVYRLKPPRLPADIIIVNYREFNPCEKIIKQMLKKHIIIHDGLGIAGKIRKCLQDTS